MKKPIYSIGIIFKNEIRCLERCLKSLQPLRDAVPCEVVMADTGSADGSREVAEKYADILFDFPWVNDFSAARNAVMDRCSGVWYFSIDADEWLAEDISEFVAFSRAKGLPWDFAGINIRNYRTPGLERDQDYLDFIGVRMARLSTGVRYHGCIHESWKSPDGGLLKTMTLDDIWLYHDGYVYASKDAERAKHERNMALLNKKLGEDPQNLQTLMECIDSSKHGNPVASAEYARQAVEGLRQKWRGWERIGPVVYHNAVSVAGMHELPELEDWANQAFEQYPDSIFTRVDVSYHLFSYYWKKKEYDKAIPWCEAYRKGIADYRAGNFDHNEIIRGVLEYSSPAWERKILVLLPQAYLECGEPEKAYSAIQRLKGGELDDMKQVELCALMLMRLHRTALLDTQTLVSDFWDQISQPNPDGAMAEKRRKTFIQTASNSFTPKYQKEEEGREDFLRHACTVFAGLKGKCALGDAAAILGETDALALTEQLASVDKLEELPTFVLIHALEHGAAFPVPGKTMYVEEMDRLASSIAGAGDTVYTLLESARGNTGSQASCWTRGLALAAIRVCKWDSPERDMALARRFAGAEREFLSLCCSPQALSNNGIWMLPPMHRFGWYCAQAFDALDAGDSLGYVRLLRAGLEACRGMKAMVEFLIDNTPQLAPQPSDELAALADQVRALLSKYPPDDPAVAEIKSSPAYRQVACYIEGVRAPVYGGLPQ